jgi:D-serine deaminase-like pyridoxal phosphate-dependent protein
MLRINRAEAIRCELGLDMHISEIDTPALLLDLDIMEKNLQKMADYCRRSGVGLRPHIKTHKIPAIAQRQIELGAVGITAAKPSEAAIMAEGGIRNILIAYPIVSSVKAEALVDLMDAGVKISVSMDSMDAANCLSRAAEKRGQKIGLLVEIDVGFGRCGVSGPREAVALAASVNKLPGVYFAGLMYYPGHMFVKGEAQDRLLRAVNEKVDATYDALLANGFNVDWVSGGSSPTALRSMEFTHLTEIRPGMYPLNDRNLVEGGFATVEDCALKVMVTVVSTAVPGRAILDGGSKTFSSDRLLTGDGRGFGLLHEDPQAIFCAMSEEHGHLDITGSSKSYRAGQRICVIPNHVCTTINMHNQIYAVRGEQVVETWQVAARGCVR